MHLKLVGNNEGETQKKIIFSVNRTCEKQLLLGCSLLDAFDLMFNKDMLYAIPRAYCCYSRHSHQSDFVDNLFLLSLFSNRIKTTASLLFIFLTDVFLYA